MFIKINSKFYFFTISFFIVFIDQLSKYLIFNKYNLLINRNFLLFTLDYVKNYGAAFNILDGNIILLSTFSTFISIILIYLLLRKNLISNTEYYSYSFILGGTIGNGIDRILRGFVIDFINLNIINFPVFNVADVAINIGFVFLLFNIFKNNR